MSYLSGEVSVGLVILIDVEFIGTDVAVASISIASIAIASIVNKDYLLADDPTSINLVTIRALADASIVKEHQRALTLQASGGFGW